jgi:crotonobetainyl-CoA:carnitine CoA-transferase CaiB-like acyl-CoA transferase
VKLTGVRVIDLSVFLPGPYLTMNLADHGAEVIKIEPPGGDPARGIGVRDGPETVLFRSLNRGKRSVVIDLKTDDGREALLRLCDRADVFVESFRPGVMERLGFGYDALQARNLRLVYCSISAFGQEGPYRDRPAHDLAVEALAGALSVNLGQDGNPAIPGVPVSDLLSAMNGLAGILMALLRRQQTGRGDYIDVAMNDAMLAASVNVLGSALAQDQQPIASHERTTGGSAFYRIYRTKDDLYIVLGGQEAKFVHTLLDTFNRPDLVALCERGPGPHQQPVVAFLTDLFKQHSRAEWIQWMASRDICFAPVNSQPEALRDPQVQYRQMVVGDRAGRKHLATAIRFREEPGRPNLHEPWLGEHTSDIVPKD